MSVVADALMVPVADHTGGKDQQRDERQGNRDDSNRFPHFGLVDPIRGQAFRILT